MLNTGKDNKDKTSEVSKTPEVYPLFVIKQMLISYSCVAPLAPACCKILRRIFVSGLLSKTCTPVL